MGKSSEWLENFLSRNGFSLRMWLDMPGDTTVSLVGERSVTT